MLYESALNSIIEYSFYQAGLKQSSRNLTEAKNTENLKSLLTT